ncbi:hypothetical protein [Shewanella ulleungensis]|jgi:hypothetical protein|uniref:DUF2970 domain-containing protein n=1 Tax=Shewanella ulleungensis TaxID=2282699 RepID=A0ABQ2QPW3_9GAMM|nr:hypothetical protein [Shewanella ulleungensis]MCL1150259.1 hypothetical protein [Shewanella ulleungensis]GGP88712.1 hypothetical protein GCM10009410_23410 [Shewanella ulleungensis]
MDFLAFILQIVGGSSPMDLAQSAKQDKTLLWMIIIGGVIFSAFFLMLYYLASQY